MSTSGKDLKLPKSLPPYGDYQNEIYLAGLEGVLPQFPVDYRTLEARAAGALPASILSYVQSGCGDGTTQIRNVEAFGHWGMTPRMMVDSSKRDLSIELFGLKLPSPLFMAPIGMTGMCTQDSRVVPTTKQKLEFRVLAPLVIQDGQLDLGQALWQFFHNLPHHRHNYLYVTWTTTWTTHYVILVWKI
jgi:hypothetical protein